MRDDIPMVHMWCGHNVEDMTRDELLAVVRHMGCEYIRLTSPEANRIRALGEVEDLKRGARPC